MALFTWSCWSRSLFPACLRMKIYSYCYDELRIFAGIGGYGIKLYWELMYIKLNKDASLKYKVTVSIMCWSFHRVLLHGGGTSTLQPSSGQRCLYLGAEQTASVPSTLPMRSIATRSKYLTQRPTAGLAPLQHSHCQRDAEVTQPVRHTHTHAEQLMLTRANAYIVF